MPRTCTLSIVLLFLMIAFQVNDSVHALPSKRVPALGNFHHRSILVSPFVRARHRRRQVITDWDDFDSKAPPVATSPAANQNSDSPISFAPSTPIASSSLAEQSDETNLEAIGNQNSTKTPAGISPIQIRHAILNMSMPFALSCLALAVFLTFLVWRGSAAVSSNARQILLTSYSLPNHKVLQ